MIPAANQIVLKAISIDDIGVTVVEPPCEARVSLF